MLLNYKISKMKKLILILTIFLLKLYIIYKNNIQYILQIIEFIINKCLYKVIQIFFYYFFNIIILNYLKKKFYKIIIKFFLKKLIKIYFKI